MASASAVPFRARAAGRRGSAPRGAVGLGPGAARLAVKIPAGPPAGELGEALSRRPKGDHLVLLALLAPELLELVSERARAAPSQEALELGIAPGRLALEQQRIREELRQVPCQQTPAHGAPPSTPNVRGTGYVRQGGRPSTYESNFLSTRPGPSSCRDE